MLKYDIIAERGGKGRIFKWGEEEKNWISKYRSYLDSADRISFIEKDSHIVTITVSLNGSKRFVFFSRVFGKVNSSGQEKQVRLYCIGWQDTIKGINVKSLNWVYPDGMIENSEEPSYIHHFI